MQHKRKRSKHQKDGCGTDTDIGVAGWRGLSSAIEFNTTLTTLILSCEPTKQQVTKHAATVCIKVHQTGSKFKPIHRKRDHLLCRALQRNTTLTQLVEEPEDSDSEYDTSTSTEDDEDFDEDEDVEDEEDREDFEETDEDTSETTSPTPHSP